MRTYLKAVASVPESNVPLVFSTGFAVLHPRPQVDGRFLAYYLQSDGFVEKLVRNSEGVSYPAIAPSTLMALGLRVPDRTAQRAIADYLDRETAQIDVLVEKQERLSTTLHERYAVARDGLLDGVAGPSTGSRLKHYVSMVRQGWSPECFAWPADGVTEWGVLKTGCVNWGRFRPSENKALPPYQIPRPETVVRQGQVVVSRASTRELVGSAALVDSDFPRLMLSDKLYAFSLTADAVPAFVAHLLSTRRIRDLIELEATGSSPSMQNVSQADILNLPIELPSVEVQEATLGEIERQRANADALIGKSQEFVGRVKERRAALITAAVTGQIDVRSAA